jgi:hypothetical protein
MSLVPTVRYLIVCEDVQTDPQHALRVTLVGLLSAIRSIDDPPFPLLYRELCVYVQLAECRGPGDGHIEIRHADSDRVVFQTRTRTLPLGTDPLALFAVSFRIQNCLFPEAGLYWVQLWYNGAVLAQHPILLRDNT